MHTLRYTGTTERFPTAKSHSSMALSLLVLALVSVPLHGQQNPFTAIHGTTDQGVMLPQKSPMVGRQDPAALLEIRAYQKAIGLAAWADMKGTGLITSNTADHTVENATLWILGQNRYRLDVETSRGTQSTILGGPVGAVRNAGGQVKPVDARDSHAGLFSFPLLADANFPNPNTSLTDNGMVSVDGVSLHRITVEWPWEGNPLDANGNARTSVVDFYFNPQTHLLMKTVNAVIGSMESPAQLLRAISYDDYRVADGIKVPYQYRQTLNGQLLWTLQLNEIQLHIGLANSSFQF